MSENARAPHPLVGSLEEILQSRGLNIPGQYATTQSLEQIEQTFGAAPVAEDTTYIGRRRAPEKSPVVDRFAAITDDAIENATLLGTSQPAILEHDATTPVETTADSSARKFNFQKLNPANYARDIAARAAANGAQEKVEKGSRYVRAAVVIGGLAAAAATAAATIYGARHGIHIGPIDINGTNNGDHAEWHDGQPTWHDAPATPDTHIQTPDPNHVSPDAGHRGEFDHSAPATSHQPDTGAAVPAPSKPQHHDTYQTALSYDKDTGRASNVTDWSRETIYDEAREAGLSKAQATALSHDQGNIHDVNSAFYHDNRSVGHDSNHTIFAGHNYKMTGSETKADHIIDQFKAEHHIKPATEAPATHQPDGAAHGSPQPSTTPGPETSASAEPKTQETTTTPPTYQALPVEHYGGHEEPDAWYQDKLVMGLGVSALTVGLTTAVLGGHAIYTGRRANIEANLAIAEVRSRSTIQQQAVLALANAAAETAEPPQADKIAAAPVRSHRESKDNKPTFSDPKDKKRSAKQRTKGVKAIRKLAKK